MKKGMFSFVGTIGGLKTLIEAEYDQCVECQGWGFNNHQNDCIKCE